MLTSNFDYRSGGNWEIVEFGEGTILLQGSCPRAGQEMDVKESNFLGEEGRFRSISGLKTHSTAWFLFQVSESHSLFTNALVSM